MSKKYHDYHLVDPSPWPFLTALSAVTLFVGLAMTIHDKPHGSQIFYAGTAALLSITFFWWRDTVKEGHDNHHTKIVQKGLRLGMLLFITSEIMFFVAFFWAFFKAAIAPVLVFEGASIFESNSLDFGIWPPAGIETFDAWDLPFINTLILLLSGCTVTWAHYAVLKNKQKEVVKALSITVLLGVLFTILQAVEYSHAAFCLNGLFSDLLTWMGFAEPTAESCAMNASHIYPSTFYLATGFHGAHVIIGTIFLSVCLVRAIRGGFSKKGHLGFEFAAWYWHFVDIVWLFLFLFVYVWGA